MLVLGIGNILWADEGFGVRAVEAFHRRYELPDDVVLLDGGTQGLYLVQHVVQEADDLLVFDAIDYGLPPGTLNVVHGRGSAEIHRREENEPAPDRLSGSADRRRSARRAIRAGSP